MIPLYFNVAVSGIRQLTPFIREYLLTEVNGASMPKAQPGSHIEIHGMRAGTGPFVRHYSVLGGIGDQDDPPDTHRIAIRRGEPGRASSFIHETFDLGSRLAVSRPKNAFFLDRTAADVLLIAGGIGITPIYSMLRSLARRKRSFRLVYAARAESGHAYAEEMLKLAGDRVTLINSSAARLNLRELLAAQDKVTQVYVCGPNGMILAAYEASKDLGWDPNRVYSEVFSAARTSAEDHAFDVELRQSGKTIRVGRDTTILDALLAAGYPALYDCRRGECGLCPLKILESPGGIDHRDRYLDEEERDSGKTLCVCVSRARGNRLVLDA